MKGIDYGFKTTTPLPGETLESNNRWRRAYVATAFRLTTQVLFHPIVSSRCYAKPHFLQDAYIAGVMHRSSNWLAPVTDLFSPVIVAKVVWAMTRELIGI